ncbi:MAG: hypothetical protein ACO1TE_17475 [Prosthecobacter sp.]
MNKEPDRPDFASTLFGGSTCLRWVVGPFALISAVMFVLPGFFALLDGETTKGLTMLVVGLASMLLFLAVVAGSRFPWAARVLTGLVFAAYLWYVLDTWLIHPKPLEAGASRGKATPWNALCGLLVIGCPCLCYTFLGRLTLSAPEPADDEMEDADADDFDDAEEDDDIEEEHENTRPTDIPSR